MEVVVVSLFTCIMLGISYVLFGKSVKVKKQKEAEERMRICCSFQQEIDNMEKLELVGIGSDENSDFKFIEAVRKIDLPEDVRVQLYD